MMRVTIEQRHRIKMQACRLMAHADQDVARLAEEVDLLIQDIEEHEKEAACLAPKEP